jgi:Replication-relaxation
VNRRVPRGQELRSHLVRRLPTAAELATRATIVLTERDESLLIAVHVHGFLTAELIELAFFPTTGDGRSWPSSCAYERLRQLWLWDYLERVELPVARVLGGRRPFLYALGRRGLRAVRAGRGGAGAAVQPRRLDRLDHVFVEHDLKAAALWANVHNLLRGRCVRAFRWTPERDLRARRLRVRDPDRPSRWLPFLPDGAFEVVYRDGRVQSMLIEIDMGTLTLERFRRKVRAFEACVEDGVFARHFQRQDFEVAVLVPSRARLVHLWRATRQEVSRDRTGSYLFATFDALEPSRFARAEWVTAANRVRALLDRPIEVQSA